MLIKASRFPISCVVKVVISRKFIRSNVISSVKDFSLYSSSQPCSLHLINGYKSHYSFNGDHIRIRKNKSTTSLVKVLNSPSFHSTRHFYRSPFRNKDNKKKDNQNESQSQTMISKEVVAVGLIALGINLFFLYQDFKEKREKLTVSWDQFVQEILPSGEIQYVYIDEKMPHKGLVYFHRGAQFYGRKMRYIETAVHPGESLELKLRIQEEKMGIKKPYYLPVTHVLQSTLLFYASALTALLLFLVLVIKMFPQQTKLKMPPPKKAKPPTDAFSSFNPFKMFDTDVGYAKNTNVKFDDVAGMQEAKQEVIEFVQFLKSPENYQRLGAKMPRGCLLTGPPGVGKTLLAKAVASEAGVPFIAKAGSDFVEMIGGLGARRIRQLFEKARESAPCIIYIDELDALGAARSNSDKHMPAMSEKDQTLNQILVEMDGMLSQQHQVIVLASTNRPDILDKALLRPGRFDRLIHIDLPTRIERKEILNRHLKDIKIKEGPEKYSTQLANETPGMSGADLANICNEAAIYAAREGDDFVDGKHLNYALERITTGAPKSTTSLTPEERRKVAVHESGHALVGWLLEHTNALAKITIIPRSKGALGITRTVSSDRHLHSQEQVMDNMCMALGGRAAEQLVFGNVTHGAQDDLERVTKMAYAQVKQFGFNDTVGPLSFQEQGRLQTRPYSEALATIIDREAKKLVMEAYDRAKNVLSNNRDLLEKLFTHLLEQETLSYDEVLNLIGPPPFEGKKQIRDIPFQEVEADAAQADDLTTKSEGKTP